MSSLSLKKFSSLAVEVKMAHDMLQVYLADGRIVSVPLEWFPRLRDASEKERNDWRLIGGGVGIHIKKVCNNCALNGNKPSSIPW